MSDEESSSSSSAVRARSTSAEIQAGGSSPSESGQPTVLHQPLQGSPTVKITENHVSFRSGPICSPEELREYAAVNPSFPERLLAMAEAEQRERHSSNRKLIDGQFLIQRRGQWFALAITVLGIGGAAWMAHEGHEWPASILAGAPIATIATAFIAGKFSNKDNQPKSVPPSVARAPEPTPSPPQRKRKNRS